MEIKKITIREFNAATAERLNDLFGGILERTKAYVKRALEKAERDESVRRWNKDAMFIIDELAGFISIAEYGNEQARKLALVDMYNLEDGHSIIYLKQNWESYIQSRKNRLTD